MNVTSRGHVRLCARCSRDYFLDWVPEPALDPPPFVCVECAGPRPKYRPPFVELSDEVSERIRW